MKNNRNTINPKKYLNGNLITELGLTTQEEIDEYNRHIYETSQGNLDENDMLAKWIYEGAVLDNDIEIMAKYEAGAKRYDKAEELHNTRFERMILTKKEKRREDKITKKVDRYCNNSLKRAWKEVSKIPMKEIIATEGEC